MPDQRARLANNLGKVYQLCFALLIVASIVTMVLGWRSMSPEQVYNPPGWGHNVAIICSLLTFILFAAAKSQTNIKRVLRHPQLLGLVIWSVGHLLANGDQRSLILFTALGAWAIVEMLMINKRDGEWVKPEPLPGKADIITLVKGLVLFSVFFFLHPWLSGVPLLNG
jgi:uncharacterized membrane protein